METEIKKGGTSRFKQKGGYCCVVLLAKLFDDESGDIAKCFGCPQRPRPSLLAGESGQRD